MSLALAPEALKLEIHGKHGYGGPFGSRGDVAANQISGLFAWRSMISARGYSSLSYLHRFSPLDTLKNRPLLHQRHGGRGRRNGDCADHIAHGQ